MRAVKRLLFKVVLIASLLLLFGTTALYVRSYFTSDIIDCEEPGETCVIHDLYEEHGTLVIVEDIEVIRFLNGEEDDGPTPTVRRWSFSQRPVETGWHHDPSGIWNVLGFYFDEGDAHGVKWTVPLWPLLLLGVPLPIHDVAQKLRRRRLVSGKCIQCGYDMRATPERCPECGTVHPTSGTTT